MGDEVSVGPAGLLSKNAQQPEREGHSVRHLRGRVLGGSFIMLLSSVFVGGVNFVYNFAIAHALGADNFGHASVLYTVLLLLSSVTLSFQLVCSKFVARTESPVERSAIYHLLHRRAWLAGLSIGLVLLAASKVISAYLNLPSSALVDVLAIGIVFYCPLGVRRGLIQGTYQFWPLAANFALEVIVKLIGTVVLMSAGYGVEGVVGATSASIMVAYFAAIPYKHHARQSAPATLHSGMEEGVQALIFFIGQVVINNLDIILVKHFFEPTQAGIYAVIALLGRVVYMLCWQVISAMFPFSAGVQSEQKGRWAVLSTALLLVVLVSTIFVVGAWLAPIDFWRFLLGAGFPIAAHGFSSLLVLYAVMTGIYSIAIVLMTYEISRKIGNVSWVQLGFSGAIVVGIYLLHNSLLQVTTVQLILKTLLLFVVAIPFLKLSSAAAGAESAGIPWSAVKKIKRVEEDEAIAEFLKGEFYEEEFTKYRKLFANLVNYPNLNDERENSLRRALLYRRRGRLWRELPHDTEWWEVELNAEDLLRTRVFPRNQWLRYGAPTFLLLRTADRIRSRIISDSRDPFIHKLRSMSLDLAGNADSGSIILITIDESSPITIIEGNHRMTAAALVSPGTMHTRFRFLCGFSPRMAECCWYQTDVSTLWHYAKNTVAYYIKYREKLTTRVLEPSDAASNQSRIDPA